MKRILYKKISDRQFQTKEEISIADNKKAVALFDTINNSYVILDLATNTILMRGYATSKHKLLIKIKDGLTSLGAEFGKEKRYSTLPEVSETSNP